MYEFKELTTVYDYPIEVRIIEFLEFYNIPKENIIKIRIINNRVATIIFDSSNTKYNERESARELRELKF